MKMLTIISGKGGTGKTSLTAAFAHILKGNVVLVDGDVDASNLGLLTGPKVMETYDFYASKAPFIEAKKCDQCGLCRELCRFEAITSDYEIDRVSCEGCAFCAHACPRKAVEMKDKKSGQWFVSSTPYGFLVHACLGIAEENSGKLVTVVRNRGAELAETGDMDYLLVDGPPGIGCPVIASLSGVDAALIVTEPTVSGIHDLERVVALCRHFQVKVAVCINRYDLGIKQSELIAGYCRKEKITLAGRIPFDRVFVDAMLQGLPVNAYTSGPVARRIAETWRNFLELAV